MKRCLDCEWARLNKKGDLICINPKNKQPKARPAPNNHCKHYEKRT